MLAQQKKNEAEQKQLMIEMGLDPNDFGGYDDPELAALDK